MNLRHRYGFLLFVAVLNAVLSSLSSNWVASLGWICATCGWYFAGVAQDRVDRFTDLFMARVDVGAVLIEEFAAAIRIEDEKRRGRM